MRLRFKRINDIRAVVLITLLICFSSPSLAGTICGTVRDIDTLAPVPRAGIFVRTQEGAYTGHHGATAEDGTFCIDEITAGTYDLEITVDDYETRYLRGVEVTDETTDVDIDIFEAEHFLYSPWPNPAQSNVTFRYRVGDPVPVRMQIYDVRGRFVRGWQDLSPSTGVHQFDWDLRSRDGARIASGVYFVRFSAGSVNRIRVIVTLN